MDFKWYKSVASDEPSELPKVLGTKWTTRGCCKHGITAPRSWAGEGQVTASTPVPRHINIPQGCPPTNDGRLFPGRQAALDSDSQGGAAGQHQFPGHCCGAAPIPRVVLQGSTSAEPKAVSGRYL